jgi:RNA polymerase sigma-70 factor (ECF subfamily)
MRDSRLIQQLKAGDATACAAVVREHYARVYRLLVHLTRDTHRAEDLCQETFAAAWAKIDSFAGESSIATWLHRIAYRQFLDWLRAGKRERTDQKPIEPSTDSVEPLAALFDDEETKSLYAALDRIDRPHREVLVLHYLLGFSYQEMAAIIEQPIGTMKWRTSVALEQMREILGDDDVGQRRTKPGKAAAGPAPAADSGRA